MSCGDAAVKTLRTVSCPSRLTTPTPTASTTPDVPPASAPTPTPLRIGRRRTAPDVTAGRATTYPTSTAGSARKTRPTEIRPTTSEVSVPTRPTRHR